MKLQQKILRLFALIIINIIFLSSLLYSQEQKDDKKNNDFLIGLVVSPWVVGIQSEYKFTVNFGLRIIGIRAFGL